MASTWDSYGRLRHSRLTVDRATSPGRPAWLIRSGAFDAMATAGIRAAVDALLAARAGDRRRPGAARW